MKWTPLELAILAMVQKLPNNLRSPTPRERHWLLTAIRLSFVGIVLVLMCTLLELVADWTTSLVLGIMGIVLLALGEALLIIALILAGIGGIIFRH